MLIRERGQVNDAFNSIRDSNRTTLKVLPQEIWYEIFMKLDKRALLHARSACHFFNTMTKVSKPICNYSKHLPSSSYGISGYIFGPFIRSFAVNRQGEIVIGSFYILNTDTKEKKVLSAPEGTNIIALNSNDELIFSKEDRTLEIWTKNTKGEYRSTTIQTNHTSSIIDLAHARVFGWQDVIASKDFHDNVCFWVKDNTGKYQELNSGKNEGSLNMAFSEDGTLISCDSSSIHLNKFEVTPSHVKVNTLYTDNKTSEESNKDNAKHLAQLFHQSRNKNLFFQEQETVKQPQAAEVFFQWGNAINSFILNEMQQSLKTEINSENSVNEDDLDGINKCVLQ